MHFYALHEFAFSFLDKVANARMFAFSRLLFYWKGSIYKLIYKEMIVFCCLYASLSLNYRFVLADDHKRFIWKTGTNLSYARILLLFLECSKESCVTATRWRVTFHFRSFLVSTCQSSLLDGGTNMSTFLGQTGAMFVLTRNGVIEAHHLQVDTCCTYFQSHAVREHDGGGDWRTISSHSSDNHALPRSLRPHRLPSNKRCSQETLPNDGTPARSWCAPKTLHNTSVQRRCL